MQPPANCNFMYTLEAALNCLYFIKKTERAKCPLHSAKFLAKFVKQLDSKD
jgi:hypothetical protein